MKTNTRVLIVGGGITGVSTLYHLAKMGWSDVTLIERTELTAGSTWHAAGNLPHFSGSFQVMQLQKYSIELYSRLEAETGQAVGHHPTGSIRLAHTQDRMDEYHRVAGYSEMAGLGLRVLSCEEMQAMYPGLVTEGLLGGLYDPGDGHIAPADVTMAMAKGARDMGATIHRNCPATAIRQLDDGRWEVTTPNGVITADVLVNAGGFRAHEIAAMVGHRLPIISMEHQYLVTESVPELEAMDGEVPMIRDPDVSYYLRQERKGMILGPYEPDCVPWAVDGVPPHFGQELLEPSLDRLEAIMEKAMETVPMLAKAGIQTVVNGPISYTPDGHPLIGPTPGYDNYYTLAGFSFGITQGGGAGKAMAEWIVNGHPEIDLWECDPRRFGPFATKSYTLAKAMEVYANEYQLSCPGEYAARPAARPAKTTPIYGRLDALGAVFHLRFGWERADWFAPAGVERKERYGFRRTNAFEHIGAECRAVREGVGVLDLSGFTKFEVSGPGAEAFLDRIQANRLPKKVGGVTLAHVLDDAGGTLTEFTITRLAADRFYLVSAAVTELHDQDLLRKLAPRDGSVRIDNVTARYGCLVLAGPRSREVLAKLTDAPLTNAAFPWLTAQEIEVAGAVVRALRVNFIGELGWEIHHPIEQQLSIFDQLMAAGAEFGIRPFGLRAMDSLRLEKGYRMWGTELSHEYSLLESAMEPFIRFEKGEFTGREALLKQREAGVPRRLAMIEVDAADADAYGMEPVYCEGQRVGIVTSGGYGHCVGKSLALVMLRAGCEAPGTPLQVRVLGDMRPATVLGKVPFDPENIRPRAD